MRYVQYGRDGRSRPGVLYDEYVIDLEELLVLLKVPIPGPLASLRSYIEAGEKVWASVRTWMQSNGPRDLGREVSTFELSSINLEAPLKDAHKLVLVAGNYREHIREVGYRVPEAPESVTPQFFMKPPSTTVIGPGEEIHLSRRSIFVDWEVELAAVIAKRGRYIPEDEALGFVFGYTIVNDISEREFNSNIANRVVREKDPLFDWLHGKWFDTFAPMGPVIVTPDEIPDPHNLRISLSLNDELQQESDTGGMIHRIPYLIHKLSHIMTIEAGDVLSTGTPSGVGYRKGIRLHCGDVLECEIEGIGVLRNRVIEDR